ncbi:MAG: redoxin domain-containing protein [Micromonosporaceae bacterium]|nr:redoxin domain-containing protein [Micromonosporaceae bacterium]
MTGTRPLGQPAPHQDWDDRREDEPPEQQAAPRGPRVRAPELRGRGWLNTGGEPVTLQGLRGKIVLLDFWTFCCVNCLHVLDELRPLEAKYADVLVVIGVHSPKFEHERDPEALAAAVERYGVRHPVLDDPELRTWQLYATRAWPTLSVIDPEGYVVATMAGEGHAEGLCRLLAELAAEHEAKGTLRRGDGPYVPPERSDTVLRFPGKVSSGPGRTLLVSDTARHSLVELACNGETVLRRIGSGERGRADGDVATARFNEPQGLCVLPARVAERAGYDVVVADTVNHLLRGVRLANGDVVTVCGTGRQWRSTVDFDPHDARSVDLSSPWDVVWYPAADDGSGLVIVAMAGIHQLWWFDPVKRTTGGYAGTTVEGLHDGPAPEAFLAQPSGLAVSPDGARLWIADAETSAIRYVEDDVVHTVVGAGLFDFGHRDGPAAEALLQHPLGVGALPDGSVAIADTYNGAIRRYDPQSGEVTTLATDLAEPSDVVFVGGSVVVVESAAHRLIRPVAPGAARRLAGAKHTTERPASELAPGEVTLEVVFTPPSGQKVDDTYGAPVRLEVSASPPELLVAGGGVTRELTRGLVLADGIAGGVLEVVAQVATCDAAGDNAACHLIRQDWGVPLRLAADGPRRLELVLYGESRGWAASLDQDRQDPP